MGNNIENADLTFLEKVLSKILKRYTYKIYRRGIILGFNWAKDNKFDIR